MRIWVLGLNNNNDNNDDNNVDNNDVGASLSILVLGLKEAERKEATL